MQTLYSDIQRFPEFQKLDVETLTELSKLLIKRPYSRNASITKYGETDDEMYFILDGTVEAFYTDALGVHHPFEPMTAGMFFGEVAILTNGKRSASARAITEVHVLVLKQNDLPELLKIYPPIAILLMQGMAKRLSRSGGQIRKTLVEVQQQIAQQRKPLDKTVDWLVKGICSKGFVGSNVLLVISWLAYNMWFKFKGTDAEYALLGLVLSIESLLASSLVLVKQARDEAADSTRFENMYETVLRTEKELRALHAELDGVLPQRIEAVVEQKTLVTM